MPERWLSGPIEGVRPMVMPAAHTFLQVREDIPELLSGLSSDQIWRRIGKSASIGYHAVHIAGATGRLLTYARGQQLTDAQLADVRAEPSVTGLAASELVQRVERAMDLALDQLRTTTDEELFATRQVGRKLLPSTTWGIIAHAAEHALRHAGQIATLKKALS